MMDEEDGDSGAEMNLQMQAMQQNEAAVVESSAFAKKG